MTLKHKCSDLAFRDRQPVYVQGWYKYHHIQQNACGFQVYVIWRSMSQQQMNMLIMQRPSSDDLWVSNKWICLSCNDLHLTIYESATNEYAYHATTFIWRSMSQQQKHVCVRMFVYVCVCTCVRVCVTEGHRKWFDLQANATSFSGGWRL